MDLDLDRLTLRVSGISAAQGRELADLVGRRLAGVVPPTTGGSTESLHVSIPARSGEPLDMLAQRIVTEMLRSLARSS